MRISAIRDLMVKTNQSLCKEDYFAFNVINDNSLVLPRKKELHNVLVNRNCKVHALNDAKERWTISTKNQHRFFSGTLEECFLYCVKHGYANLKLRLFKKVLEYYD